MTALRQWKWPPLPPYNGFTHQERVLGWQCLWWLIDNALVPSAKVCCITGTTDNIQYHSENYYAPWTAYPIARDVHMKLHRRFNNPAVWEKIATEHAQTGDEWFARLSMTPVDLAAQLRAQHGNEIRNVFDRAELTFADRKPKACFAPPRPG